MNHVTHILSSTDISIFPPEISKFCYIKKWKCRFHFGTQFLILLTFFESLKIVLINIVTILMMSAKAAALGLLEIKVFWNKKYDVIISAHNVSNKVLSRDSNYIVEVQEWASVKLNYLGLVLGIAFKFYTK